MSKCTRCNNGQVVTVKNRAVPFELPDIQIVYSIFAEVCDYCFIVHRVYEDGYK